MWLIKDEVELRAEKVHEELGSVVATIRTEHAESIWAEVAKRNKTVKKNLWHVKASTQGKKATYMKDGVSQGKKRPR